MHAKSLAFGLVLIGAGLDCSGQKGAPESTLGKEQGALSIRQESKLMALDPRKGDGLGNAVSLFDGRALVGCSGDDRDSLIVQDVRAHGYAVRVRSADRRLGRVLGQRNPHRATDGQSLKKGYCRSSRTVQSLHDGSGPLRISESPDFAYVRSNTCVGSRFAKQPVSSHAHTPPPMLNAPQASHFQSGYVSLGTLPG